jgi:hypothetical protein
MTKSLETRLDRLEATFRAMGGGGDDGDDPGEVRWWTVARLERAAGLSADDLADLSDGDLVLLAEAAGARRGLPGGLAEYEGE